MTLTEMLGLLPEMTSDGTYYELRKLDGWSCAKTNIGDCKDYLVRSHKTPEGAVSSMLTELNILGPPPLSQERIDYMDEQHRKNRRRLGLSSR